ncbi:G-protein coupled receptor GRL101 [Procambarus clarkii]|uniref:G-protein coupled receptor GRL101 n=1 Tax=Procambarus clarkii TaxID=6728 RepID=UPI003741E904
MFVQAVDDPISSSSHARSSCGRPHLILQSCSSELRTTPSHPPVMLVRVEDDPISSSSHGRPLDVMDLSRGRVDILHPGSSGSRRGRTLYLESPTTLGSGNDSTNPEGAFSLRVNNPFIPSRAGLATPGYTIHRDVLQDPEDHFTIQNTLITSHEDARGGQQVVQAGLGNVLTTQGGGEASGPGQICNGSSNSTVFLCSPGECIPTNLRCNGVPDCDGGEDESVRECGCLPNEFQCGASCIDLVYRCDTFPHCSEGQDEHHCETFVCPASHFKCNNHFCVPSEQVCDFHDHCGDGSDEHHCHHRQCWKSEFECSNGQCIRPGRVCDHHHHCKDGSDETSCRPEDFAECGSGARVHRFYWCDGWPDCPDNHADELHCVSRCELGESLTCMVASQDRSKDRCIASSHICDGRSDCHNGQYLNDESGCERPECSSSEWQCLSGQCIDKTGRCDLEFQCFDKTDEIACDLECVSKLLCLCVGKESLREPAGTSPRWYLQWSVQPPVSQAYFSPRHGAGTKVFSVQIQREARSVCVYIYTWRMCGCRRCISVPRTFSVLSVPLNRKSVIDFTFAIQDSLIFRKDLRGNPVDSLGARVFSGLTNLHYLWTDEFRFCCLARHVHHCRPQPDEFSSCEDLMTNTVLRVCVWVLGSLALSGNLLVIVWRFLYHTDNRVHSFLITNLALGDLCMGLYLLIIAAVDVHYRGVYFIYDAVWRTSPLCRLAGFFSTFSSELSVFTLTVITLERLVVIIFPFRVPRLSMRWTKVIMGVVWACVGLLAALPLTDIHYFRNFYGRSGVCLALHITHEKPSGWEYSVFVFLVLNLVSFSVIAGSYWGMYQAARTSSAAVRSDQQVRESSMATKMTLIVVTDAACWLPIILLGLVSLAGVPIPPQVFAWVAVFVLPLNAAINPLLYTLSTTPFLGKARERVVDVRHSFRWSILRRTASPTTGVSVSGEPAMVVKPSDVTAPTIVLSLANHRHQPRQLCTQLSATNSSTHTSILNNTHKTPAQHRCEMRSLGTSLGEVPAQGEIIPLSDLTSEDHAILAIHLSRRKPTRHRPDLYD